MTAMTFIHLRLHTEYSLIDGTIRLERPEPIQDDPKQRHKEERFKTLAERAAELGLPAVAVTDLNNLFGMVKFYKSAEGAGVKPIIGADLTLEERPSTELRTNGSEVEIVDENPFMLSLVEAFLGFFSRINTHA